MQITRIYYGEVREYMFRKVGRQGKVKGNGKGKSIYI